MNLALHLGVAFALFFFARRLFSSPALAERHRSSSGPLALAIALLWTVHPLQTESVTYVVQRAEMLGALFYLLTLLAVARCIEAPSPTSTRGWGAAAVAFCLLGMASKETLATAPLVALAMDRIFFSPSWRTVWQARRGLYLALTSTWIFQAALVFSSSGRKGTVGFALSIPWWEYALTQPYYLCRYLALSLWPGPLVFDYGSYVARSPGEIVPYAVLVLALVALTVVALRRRPALGFLGLAFFALLGPTSSVVPVVTQTGAEHRMYLPLAAVVALAVLGVHALARSARLRGHPMAPRIATALLVAVTLALGARTVLRNRDYQDEITLWQGVVDRWPHSSRAHNYLGMALADARRPEEAILHYEEALRLSPNEVEVHSNLGSALTKVGRPQEALAHCERVLQLKHDYAPGQNGCGLALAALGRGPEAMAHYEQALRLSPDLAEAHNNLGKALAETGRIADAVSHYEKALALEPDLAEAHNNLGMVLTGAGKFQEAVQHFARALELAPEYAEVHSNLGIILANTGHVPEAIAHYKEALRLQPDFARAYNGLGNALMNAGRPQEAVPYFEEALRLQPGFAKAHNNLGRALAADARPRDAVARFREAIRLSPDFAEAFSSLAWILATVADPTLRDPSEALRLAEQGARLSGGRDPAHLATLAEAQAAAGRQADAAATAERALEIARATGNQALAREIESRLVRYRTGKGSAPAASP